MEFTAGGQTPEEVKTQCGISQGHSHWPLLLVIEMISTIACLRSAQEATKFSKSREKIHHLMHLDDIKIFP